MEKEISNEFKKYKWDFEYRINKITPNTYNVSFPNCNIEFFINEMYNSVECFIIYKNKKYHLISALRFNKLKTGYLYHDHSGVEIIEYIKQYVFVLNNELLEYITNDFSWCQRCDKSLRL